MTHHSASTTILTVIVLAALIAACSPHSDRLATGHRQLQAPATQRATVFVPNPGQADHTVLFRTMGAAGTLFFRRHEVVLPLPSPDLATQLLDRLLEPGASAGTTAAEPAALRLQFVGGSPDTRVVGDGRLPGIVNTFIGKDPAGWHANIPTYGGIVYEGLYPGIDLVYSGGEDALKGTFVVAPGADPESIRWRHRGASQVALRQRELVISVGEDGAARSLIEREPVAWQEIGGKRPGAKPVPGPLGPVRVRYVVHEDGSVGFAVGRYDATRPLIIDPTLDYGTYFGGSGFDASFGVAFDCDNHLYIAGVTDSPDFPEPSPSPGRTLSGDRDVFVTKLDLSKTGADQLVYTTYLGGTGREHVYGMEVDCSGRAYVVGYTESEDLATTGNALQQDYGGGFSDGMAIQLDAAGASHYVSYLGGAGFEELVQVAVGDDGLMVAVGFTDSFDFPTSDDPLQAAKAGVGESRDAVVSVLDPAASGAASLVYGTYYGGADTEEGYGIDVADGIVYFAGNTNSDDLMVKHPIQATNKGGDYGDAFLAKLDPTASGDDQLLFATFLGGSGGEISAGVAAGGSGNVYWSGATGSADFPTTAAEPPPYGGGDWDAFLAKVDTTVPSLTYATRVGGVGDEVIRDIIFDASGNAYVTGGTGSEDFPTVDPIQATYEGGVAPEEDLNWYGPADAIVAAFDATGAMTFGTYLGGSGAEIGLGIARDGLGNVYVAGGTRSDDLETVSAFQGANAGAFDVFLASIEGLVPRTTDLSISKVADGDVVAGAPISYTLTITNAGPTTPVTATVVDGWTPITAAVGVRPAPGCEVDLPGGVLTCTVANLVSGRPVSRTLVLTTSESYAGALSNTALITPTGDVTEVDPENNDAGPLTVAVHAPVRADFSGSPTSGVAPLTVAFTNTSTGAYATSLWSFGDGVTSTLESGSTGDIAQAPSHTYTTTGVYTVSLTVSGAGGSDTEVKAGYISATCAVYLPLVVRGAAPLRLRPLSSLRPLRSLRPSRIRNPATPPTL